MRRRGNPFIFFIVGAVFLALGIYAGEWVLMAGGVLAIVVGIAAWFMPRGTRR